MGKVKSIEETQKQALEKTHEYEIKEIKDEIKDKNLEKEAEENEFLMSQVEELNNLKNDIIEQNNLYA